MADQLQPPPWQIRSPKGKGEYLFTEVIHDTSGSFICSALPPNAQRIVAAVNATSDIPDEALVNGVIQELIDYVNGSARDIFGFCPYCEDTVEGCDLDTEPCRGREARKLLAQLTEVTP